MPRLARASGCEDSKAAAWTSTVRSQRGRDYLCALHHMLGNAWDTSDQPRCRARDADRRNGPSRFVDNRRAHAARAHFQLFIVDCVAPSPDTLQRTS